MADQFKRKRSRIACEPCRERKRKCNGENPCDTCSQYDYQCYFDPHMRKKRTTGLAFSAGVDDCRADTSPSSRLADSPSAGNARSHLRSMEANSGAAFMRKLALKIDPVNAPRLSLFAWNFGPRGDFPPPPRHILAILTQAEMMSLARVYFDKVHPFYGYLDRNLLMQNIESRWSSPQQENHGYDTILCGVATLGCFFSCRQPTERELELAKRTRLLLDQSTGSPVQLLENALGWMLRVIYLRLTASPHVAWLASCAAMHVIEAAGLHSEPAPDSVLHRLVDEYNPELRRRLFGLAQHLNIWISFDLGRSRVALRGTSSLPPAPHPGDFTTELLKFLPLSESLDPDNNPDSSELEAVLSNVLSSTPAHPAARLTQCNLTLCVYRRLRVLNYTISGQLLDRVLACCDQGTSAAREMLVDYCPWHHVAYVPFQVICTLLAIDTRASLAQLESAMETLAAVTAAHNTDSMKEAYNTACLLVLLHQKRKEEDVKLLGRVLKIRPAVQPSPNGSSSSAAEPQLNTDASNMSWLDDLSLDIPGLQDFDWNHFLSDDVSWNMNLPNGPNI